MVPEDLPTHCYIQTFNANNNNNIIMPHSNNNNNSNHPSVQQGIVEVQSYPANNYVKAWLSSNQENDQHLPGPMIPPRNHDPQLVYRGKKRSSDNVHKIGNVPGNVDAGDAPMEGVLRKFTIVTIPLFPRFSAIISNYHEALNFCFI